MAQQLIDTTTNNGNFIGDPAKTAFTKTNANFTECYTNIAAAQTAATNAATTAQAASTDASTALTRANAANTAATTAATHISNSGIDVQNAPQANPNQQRNTSLIGYNPASTDVATMPANAGYGTVVNISTGPGQFTQFAISVNTPVAAFRNYNNSWGGWYLFWHTGNTTVDANLFVKKAS